MMRIGMNLGKNIKQVRPKINKETQQQLIINLYHLILYNSIIIRIISQKMGKKIENYILENLIGEGEFGKVYRALNQKTNQVVAIKIIKIEKFKMSPKLEQFTINEIQTLSKIQDTTHVVKFIEILKTANNYYFVYQFCNGGTLEQLIKIEGKFQQEKSIRFFEDLLKAFKILIKSNIMHRDIKPSNILLHNGVIKLADFGFCKPLKDAKDLSQTMLGSPIYMAPQILKGEVYTMKADIWSLGVVLYEMLYGYCPFEEKTIARLINLIEDGSVIFHPHVKISKRVQQLLTRMLVKDHFKRISWEDLLAFQLLPDPNQSERKEASKNTLMSESNTLNCSNNLSLNVANANKATISNPFSKKSPLGNAVNKSANESHNYQTNDLNNGREGYRLNHYSPSPTHNPDFRKKDSNQSSQDIPQIYRKLISTCIENRSKIHSGVKIINDLLNMSNSKLTVYICCFISKKIKHLNRQNSESFKQINVDKQNLERMSEIRKLFNLLQDEKGKIEEKMIPFEVEHESIVEPFDIIYLKFAEEEGLTQEKQGLCQLLKISDYLKQERVKDYSKSGKKELIEEYEKRIMQNN